MADYNSALPIRSEADGTDERVQVKIVDKDNPDTQQTTVDTDSNLHTEAHGNDPGGVDRVVRLSELGAITPDGEYDAADNTKPGNVGLIANTRSVTPGDATQTERLTSIQNAAGDKRALDVSLHDENGENFTTENPLPVTIVGSEGAEVNDFDTAAAVAAAGTSNHDYTVTAATTLELSQIWASASGKLKIEVQIETGVATDTWSTVFVAFNSTANTNIEIPIRENISVAAGVRVRVIRTNRDNQPQDVYSTISGHEIS